MLKSQIVGVNPGVRNVTTLVVIPVEVRFYRCGDLHSGNITFNIRLPNVDKYLNNVIEYALVHV